MKYFILLLILSFSVQQSERSEWEIHYLVSTASVTDNIELAAMLSIVDSTTVIFLASDTIKRYHYSPGEPDVQRIYYLTESEDIKIAPNTLKPISAPVALDAKYSVDWNSVVESTEKVKYILGFKCVEYSGGVIVGEPGHEMESFSRFWVMELSDEKERKLRPQYYIKKGIVLEKENVVKSIDGGNELVYTMKATSVKRLN